MVAASDLTCRRSSMAGMVLTVAAALMSANARASSPVFHSLFQSGLRGAPMNFCIPGLMSAVGTGNAFAGTSRGAGSAAIATAGNDSNAPQASVLKSFMALSSFVVVPHWNQLVVVETDAAPTPRETRRNNWLRRAGYARTRLLIRLK